MVTFKKVWEDVREILEKNKFENIEAIDDFDDGFMLKKNGSVTFVTKEDFVDFWCKMQCLKEVSKKQVLTEEEEKSKYIYDLIKKLPYVMESTDCLKLVE